jgi:hypothetical protein
MSQCCCPQKIRFAKQERAVDLLDIDPAILDGFAKGCVNPMDRAEAAQGLERP